MRHIPEDELHAYLDQALSRSQCIEIERHLASCAVCAGARDGIAALRDRTTALLSTLAPPRRVPPAFEVLRQRHAAQARRRRIRLHRIAWAASVIGAVGLGWSASRILGPAPTAEATRAVATREPAAAPAGPLAAGPARERGQAGAATPAGLPADTPIADRPVTVARADARRDRPEGTEPGSAGTGAEAGIPETGATRPARPAPRQPQPAERLAAGAPRPQAGRDSARPVPEPPTFQVSSSILPDRREDLPLDGVWRTLSWSSVQRERGDAPPRVDGLPVVQVQVRDAPAGQKPLTVVAQQLKSGEVIRTIEGPADDVSTLLAHQSPADSGSSWPSSGSFRVRDGGGSTMTLQRGDRILAITGHLPSDSLRAMIRRINVEMRGRP